MNEIATAFYIALQIVSPTNSSVVTGYYAPEIRNGKADLRGYTGSLYADLLTNVLRTTGISGDFAVLDKRMCSDGTFLNIAYDIHQEYASNAWHTVTNEVTYPAYPFKAGDRIGFVGSTAAMSVIKTHVGDKMVLHPYPTDTEYYSRFTPAIYDIYKVANDKHYYLDKWSGATVTSDEIRNGTSVGLIY